MQRRCELLDRPVQREQGPAILTKILPALAALLLGVSTVLLGLCGPFTDVASDGFCTFVLEIFKLGITTGTSPTTYDPVDFGGNAVVSLWKAADLTALGSFSLGTGKAVGACSDGTTFWVTMNSPGRLARF